MSTWPLYAPLPAAAGPEGPEGPEGPDGPEGPEGPDAPRGLLASATSPSWDDVNAAVNDTDELCAAYASCQLDNRTLANDTDDANAHLNSFYFFQTAQFAVLWVLFVLIVLGNSAVLLALAFNKHRKSRMNFFIMQLALADLAVGLISVPTDLVWRMTVEWHAGNLACKLIRYLQVLVTYSSTYVLVALSIDRYDAITHPMNFSRSGRRSRFLVAAAWTLSSLFAVPILILFEEKEVQGRRQCWIELTERWQWRLYMTLVALALFAVPALIISACYAVIVCTIWNKSNGLTGPSRTLFGSLAESRRGHEAGGLQLLILKRVRSVPSRWACQGPGQGPGQDAVAEGRGSVASIPRGSSRSGSVRPRSFANGDAGSIPKEEPDCRRASSRGLIPRAKVKTVKMTLVIVLVFVLCWSPYFVLNLLQVYDHIPRTQTNIAVFSFVQSLAPLNSAANPLIYCLFSTHICRALRKVPPFTWVLALRDSPVAVPDNNSGATETLTHLGTSPSRRDAVNRHHHHHHHHHHHVSHVTIRIAGVAGMAGTRTPSVAISAV